MHKSAKKGSLGSSGFILDSKRFKRAYLVQTGSLDFKGFIGLIWLIYRPQNGSKGIIGLKRGLELTVPKELTKARKGSLGSNIHH